VVNREHIDIILLDLDLAGESGVDLLPELQRVAPHARVIILTGSQDAAMHQRAVQRGAKGVILKSEASDVLHRAIQEVQAGGIWLDSALTARMLSGTLTTPEANPEEAKIASLTLREREVITLIGQGLTNKEIAQRLSVSATTVNHHLTTIYAKLKVPNRLDLAVYAYRHGLTQTPR
jgi:DNA-binding NarL/FixJ family response regulator